MEMPEGLERLYKTGSYLRNIDEDIAGVCVIYACNFLRDLAEALEYELTNGTVNFELYNKHLDILKKFREWK